MAWVLEHRPQFYGGKVEVFTKKGSLLTSHLYHQAIDLEFSGGSAVSRGSAGNGVSIGGADPLYHTRRNQKLAPRLDGGLTFEGVQSTNIGSSRRQATFFRKVAPRLDGSPLLGHSRRSAGSAGWAGNGVSMCGSDPPTSRAGGQDDGSYTNSLKLSF